MQFFYTAPLSQAKKCRPPRLTSLKFGLIRSFAGTLERFRQGVGRWSFGAPLLVECLGFGMRTRFVISRRVKCFRKAYLLSSLAFVFRVFVDFFFRSFYLLFDTFFSHLVFIGPAKPIKCNMSQHSRNDRSLKRRRLVTVTDTQAKHFPRAMPHNDG